MTAAVLSIPPELLYGLLSKTRNGTVSPRDLELFHRCVNALINAHAETEQLPLDDDAEIAAAVRSIGAGEVDIDKLRLLESVLSGEQHSMLRREQARRAARSTSGVQQHDQSGH